MSGTVATVIVFLGWLLMALVSFLMSRKALRTGVAPWQLFMPLVGRPLITREKNRLGYWFLTGPTIVLFVWSAVGSVVLALALLGIFGSLN